MKVKNEKIIFSAIAISTAVLGGVFYLSPLNSSRQTWANPRSMVIGVMCATDSTTFFHRVGTAINRRDLPYGGGGDCDTIDPELTTHNALAQGLDLTNPTKGVYNVTFVFPVTPGIDPIDDKTLTINIVDDTQLKQSITDYENTVGTRIEANYTTDSYNNLLDKYQEAKTARDTIDSTQAQIDDALTNLQTALAGLRTNKQPLQTLVDSLPQQPAYVREDAEVVAKLAAAKTVLAKDNPTVQEVVDAKNALRTAIDNAIQAEQARQNEATQAVTTAEQQIFNSKMTIAQNKINEVKDDTKKAELQARLNVVVNRYNAKKAELEQLVNTAKAADTTGMTTTSKDALSREIGASEGFLRGATDRSVEGFQTLINSLQAAIDGLRADKQPLQTLVDSLPQQPAYVQQDAEVVAKLAEANTVLQKSSPTPQEVTDAKNALQTAVDNARQAEQTRQNEATQAVDAAEQAKDTDSIAAAQAKIDAVKDDAKKAELQAKLNAVKDALDAKKAELQQLINTAKNTVVTGMTDTTADKLAQEEVEAEQTLAGANISQANVETAITELQAAINGLKTDKQPLQTLVDSLPQQPAYVQQDAEVVAKLAEANAVLAKDNPSVQEVADAKNALQTAINKTPLRNVIALHDDLEDYIKNNEDVKKALEAVTNTNNDPNPSVQDVKDKTKALEEAMQKAIDEEAARQRKADEALELAEKAIEDNKAKKDELPVVDKDAIQALIDATLDTEYKKELQARLDAINQDIEQKRSQIAADKKAEAERKLAEELAKKRAEEIKKQQSLKQPNTGVAKEENNAGLFAAIAVVATSIFAPIILFAKKKFSKK